MSKEFWENFDLNSFVVENIYHDSSGIPADNISKLRILYRKYWYGHDLMQFFYEWGVKLCFFSHFRNNKIELYC